MSEEENQSKIKEKSQDNPYSIIPRKRKMSICYFLVGIISITIGAILFFLQINLILSLLGITLFLISPFLILKIFMNRNDLLENKARINGLKSLRDPIRPDGREVNIVTFARTQLLVIMALISTALIQFLEFGATFNNENAEGCFLFLGGPSLFYPTSLLTILFIIPMVFYVLISPKIISINEMDKFYIVREKRYTFVFMTEIPKDRIIGIFLTNTKSRSRFLWIIPFGLHMWYLGQDGLFYITNQFAFFRGYRTGFFYLLQVFIDIIVLILILFRQRTHLEIHTDQKSYDLRFSLPFMKFNSEESIAKIFALFNLGELKAETRINGNNITGNKQWMEGMVKLIHSPRFIVGLLFVITSMLSRALQIYASEPLRFVLFIGGIILVIKAIKEDLPENIFENLDISDDLNNNNEEYGKNDKLLEYRKWGILNKMSCFFGTGDRNISNSSELQEMDLFDILIMVLIPLFSAMTITSDLLLIPITENSGFPLFIAIQVIGTIMALSAIWIVYLKPLETLTISYRLRKYRISLKTSERSGKKLSEYGKWQFGIRVLAIFLSFIMGTLTISNGIL